MTECLSNQRDALGLNSAVLRTGRPVGWACGRVGGRAGVRACGRAGEREGGRAGGREGGRAGGREGGNADRQAHRQENKEKVKLTRRKKEGRDI